jgi:hypothetical protein
MVAAGAGLEGQCGDVRGAARDAAGLVGSQLRILSGPLVIVTTGSRDLSWPLPRIEQALSGAAGGQVVRLLIHGGARGADALAGEAARQLGWPVQVIRANWACYGHAAGPIRNRRMLLQARQVASDCAAEVLVLGFPGGSGTEDCLRHARLLRRSGVGAIRIELVR